MSLLPVILLHFLLCFPWLMRLVLIYSLGLVFNLFHFPGMWDCHDVIAYDLGRVTYIHPVYSTNIWFLAPVCFVTPAFYCSISKSPTEGLPGRRGQKDGVMALAKMTTTAMTAGWGWWLVGASDLDYKVFVCLGLMTVWGDWCLGPLQIDFVGAVAWDTMRYKTVPILLATSYLEMSS
jgi:hypothetical protein